MSGKTHRIRSPQQQRWQHGNVTFRRHHILNSYQLLNNPLLCFLGRNVVQIGTQQFGTFDVIPLIQLLY